jgi:hypothetical protein
MAEGRRRHDWYAAKSIQNQQIGVPRNNDVGATVNRQFQKFIVLRVAARDDAR